MKTPAHTASLGSRFDKAPALEIRQIAARTHAVFENGQERARFATRAQAEAWQALRAPQPAAPAAHTPTPWRVGDCGRTVYGPKTAEPSPVTIASSDSTRTTTAEKRANVALIVAAVNSHASLTAERDQLRAALENAADALRVAGCALNDVAIRAGTGLEATAALRAAINSGRALAQGGTP